MDTKMKEFGWFIAGVFLSGVITVVIMACLQINRGEIDLGESEPK